MRLYASFARWEPFAEKHVMRFMTLTWQRLQGCTVVLYPVSDVGIVGKNSIQYNNAFAPVARLIRENFNFVGATHTRFTLYK